MAHFDINHYFMSNFASWFLSYDVMHVLHSYYMQWNIGPRVWMVVMM